MRFENFSFTDKGGRKNNEDCLGVANNIYIVADGLGGHSYGEVASREAVRYLEGTYQGLLNLSNENMHSIIEDVNSYIWDMKTKNSQYKNMASTIVVGFIANEKFNYFNVGDSRMYYFRRNKISFRSKDHSVTQACVDMGEIEEKEMRFHEDRNKLTKVLGNKKNIKLRDNFQPFSVESGDAFLLCTDGFWEYVLEEEMEKCLATSKTSKDWMEKMLKEHDKRVDGTHDNYSAVCVKICKK